MTFTISEPRTSGSGPAGRLPVVVVGAGAMGKEWLRMLATSSIARVAGIVDLDLELAKRAAGSVGLEGVVIGRTVADVAERSGSEAVINVTVPQAHRVVNEQALRAHLPVLCEKPLAPTVAEALRQVALADLTGGLLMVSQSRRYFTHLAVFREAVDSLGPLAAIRTEFFHEDHEPGFREQMAHPLLVDMSIHHFDQFRYLVRDEPVAVRCSSWNPAWSWFAGHASATAEFELDSGARFVYAGSRCTPGLQTSFNGEWRAYGVNGAASWNGEHLVELDTAESVVSGVGLEAGDGPEGIAGALAEFVRAVRDRVGPPNNVRSNVLSLAMVEGAILSSERGGERVVISDLLEESLTRAVDDERSDDVAEVLRSWPTAALGLSAIPPEPATPVSLIGHTR